MDKKKLIVRLKEFIDLKNISLNAFDASIGASNGYVGRMLKNNASVGSDMLEKISCAYPDLNLNWLLTGKGEMIISENYDKTKVEINDINVKHETKTQTNDQMEILFHTIERLSISEKNNSENVKELIAQGRQQSDNITRLVDLLYKNGIPTQNKDIKEVSTGENI